MRLKSARSPDRRRLRPPKPGWARPDGARAGALRPRQAAIGGPSLANWSWLRPAQLQSAQPRAAQPRAVPGRVARQRRRSVLEVDLVQAAADLRGPKAAVAS